MLNSAEHEKCFITSGPEVLLMSAHNVCFCGYFLVEKKSGISRAMISRGLFCYFCPFLIHEY